MHLRRPSINPNYFYPQLTGLFQVAVRFSVETESNFTSVERINEYITECEPEARDEDKLKNVPSTWPSAGNIK